MSPTSMEMAVAQIVSYLIPLVDEADHIMTLTCRYCGATTTPILAHEDGTDDIVLRANIRHELTCPLSVAGEHLTRMH